MGSNIRQMTGSKMERDIYVVADTGKIFWLRNKRSGGRAKAHREAGSVKRGSHSNGGGYRVITIDGVMYRAHQLVWMWHTGKWPLGEIDHKNGERDDNRFENLREATVPQNRMNKRIQSNNKSGYKWVSFHPQTGRWRAEVKKNGKRICDSLHLDPKSAYEVACVAAKQLHGTFFNSGRQESVS